MAAARGARHCPQRCARRRRRRRWQWQWRWRWSTVSLSAPTQLDPRDARIAARAESPLLEFNQAGVLSSADVHVADRLGQIAGESDPQVKLAIALAVRGPRLGHVFVDLATIAATATVESEEPID